MKRSCSLRLPTSEGSVTSARTKREGSISRSRSSAMRCLISFLILFASVMQNM